MINHAIINFRQIKEGENLSVFPLLKIKRCFALNYPPNKAGSKAPASSSTIRTIASDTMASKLKA